MAHSPNFSMKTIFLQHLCKYPPKYLHYRHIFP
ncbi:hypothetical protein Bhyg_05907 [Pseudolycoriella hygida]|uniref:Uncharacterized protein n=1 Tax=Pseudolycoriella hygida TaxID=35572 RepID=A0A9Q0N1M8_9DIPT|nr:hypothetical protein Bhyg_05907 [Pseudolycoriella hygida]